MSLFDPRAAILIMGCSIALYDPPMRVAEDFAVQLPRHPHGKLYKRKLRDQLLGGAGVGDHLIGMVPRRRIPGSRGGGEPLVTALRYLGR